MSAQRNEAPRERRLYRRLQRKERGVSPVVATIILVAIAVAAAAALYLFIQSYQSKLQNGIGSNNISSQYHFTIGGSTTVFPLSQLAIKWFVANNSLYNISDQQGGSVAGAEAYCAGQVEVGAASSSFTTAQLTGDGCSSALAGATVQNVVALDSIVGTAASSNPGIGTGVGQIAAGSTGQFSFNASVMLGIYVSASSTAVHQNQPGGLNSYTYPKALCGDAAPVAPPVAYPAVCPAGPSATQGHSPFEWQNIPFPAGCAVTTGGHVDFTACHFMSTATVGTNTINAYDRQDSGGTEQGFTQKYLLNGANLAKDGSGNSCGTDNQLVSCGLTVIHETGNPALGAAVAADTYGLGFNSFGESQAHPLAIAGYMGSSNAAPIFPTVTNVLGAYKGTISASSAYAPWRPLEYLTNGIPASGTAQAAYLSFVLGPEVNLALASGTGYISLYAA